MLHVIDLWFGFDVSPRNRWGFFPNHHSKHFKLYILCPGQPRKIYFDCLITFRNHYIHGSLAENYSQRYVEYHAGWQPGLWRVTVSQCLDSLSISQWMEENPSASLPHVFCTAVFMLINSQFIINVQFAYHKFSHRVIASLFH